MRSGPVIALFLLLYALAPARAGPAKEPDKTETDPEVIQKKVAEIVEEYDAIKSNQDLNQTRRRRELARRLGFLPGEESAKTLLRIVENDRDLRAVITAMEALCKVGRLEHIRRMFRHVVHEARKTVLDDYLGPALSLATDPEVPAWIVSKVLARQSTIMKLSAIEALGVLRAEVGRGPLLDLLAKESTRMRPEVHLLHELVRALGQIGGEGTKEVVLNAAASEDWRIRLAAAEVILIHFRDGRALSAMRKLLADEKPIVREVAAVAAGDWKMEPLFDELIVLMREGNLRAKQKSYEAMKAIAGKDFGYAPDVWAKWWKDKQKGDLNAAGDIKERKQVTVATYYNFKIFSDRVLFVIDVSGSMKWPDYKPNRIDVAKRELVKAIKALDEKTLFNMATFAGHVNMWHKKGEVAATAGNKERALKWIDGNLLPRGATNTYGALMEGLEQNPKVDTIFFLSDGIPSTGKYEIPEEILVKLRYANRFRKVIFNTVAIAMGKPAIEKAEKYEDPDEMYAFMKMIADWNGGTCVDIRKPWLDLDDK